MGRPSLWNSPTDSVRLPKHAIPAAVALARQLDAPTAETVKSNVQNPTAPALLPPYLLASSSAKGTYHYLVNTPIDIPAETWAAADRLLDEVCQGLSEKERCLLLGRLVEEWGVLVDD